MNLADVRTNLAAVIGAAYPNLDAYPYVPDTIPGPRAVVVGRMSQQYNQAMNGLEQVDITVHALASRADTQQGQDDLVALLAPAGLKAVIETERTLSGACQELNVPTSEGPGFVEMAGTQFWGASWIVRVWG